MSDVVQAEIEKPKRKKREKFTFDPSKKKNNKKKPFQIPTPLTTPKPTIIFNRPETIAKEETGFPPNKIEHIWKYSRLAFIVMDEIQEYFHLRLESFDEPIEEVERIKEAFWTVKEAFIEVEEIISKEKEQKRLKETAKEKD